VAFDEGLAHRVREILDDRPGTVEKRMFGGLCFLVKGHMACGIVGSELMVRVGADGHAAALEAPHAREMDFTGRPLTGMVYVAEEGIAEDEELAGWVQRGVAHAESLPPKGRPASKKRAAAKRPRAAASRRPTKRSTAPDRRSKS